ncbi:Bcl10-interacting CARD protein [Myotis brandtii]|uniref:Caspase recruitment domain-containing protein 19 n=1 Tax=Myotis brandtii TaxID=109478 RepID=S7Q8R3_MYOBR|nr:Bcl10-interacting CARD protein [Myotis brandtii]
MNWSSQRTPDLAVGPHCSVDPPQLEKPRVMGHCRPMHSEQTYCDRLVQDTPFLLSPGHLSEQQVDRIILQLNRYCPQILSNKDAEKFRNPRASLRLRLCDLLGHLQRSGERDCQEFYRALYIHAQPLHSRLPSRHTGQNSDLECADLDSGTASHFRNPRASLRLRLCDLLGHLQRSGERDCQEFYRALYIHAQPLHSRLPSRHTGQNSDLECADLDSGTASHVLSDRGPMAFLACLGLAAGLALLVYCCPPGTSVYPSLGAKLTSPPRPDGRVT